MGQENPAIPTHAVVGIQLCRNAMQKEKMYARTLPALKYANEDKVSRGPNDEKDGKDLADTMKNDKQKLHTLMGEAFHTQWATQRASKCKILRSILEGGPPRGKAKWEESGQ